MTDPFDALRTDIEPLPPRSRFAQTLRRRLLDELGLAPPNDVPTVPLPRRKPMTTTTTPPTSSDLTATPYLCVHDGAGAIDWYTSAFGAVEQFRVVGDDGRLGHAEVRVGAATFMLSDEAPALGVVSPRTLGGTATTIHLEVADVDTVYGRAVAAGATGLRAPADQAHGARHGTILDPYGHRWMLSQRLEELSLDTYAARSDGSGFRVERGPGTGVGVGAGATYVDGIWGSMTYRDPDVGIRFVTEVLGFEELVLVRGDDGGIVHSEYRWPEGGIVGISGFDERNPFLPPPGKNGLYVVTRDPQAVWQRCVAAAVDVLREPYAPHYDPDGMGFSVRDPEGNAWSFGTYTGGATT